MRMEALASGTVNIRSEPADESDSEFLLFGNDDQIPAESVAYGSVSLAIGQSFTVANDTVTVAEDSGATTINVLANDVVFREPVRFRSSRDAARQRRHGLAHQRCCQLHPRSELQWKRDLHLSRQ